MVSLPVEEFLADVAVDRQVLVPEVRIAFYSQVLGYFDVFQVQEVLKRGALEAATVTLFFLRFVHRYLRLR